VNSAVVRKRHRGGVVVPVILTGSHIPTEGGQDRAIISLHLTVCLGVVGGREDLLDTQLCASGLKELSRELGAVVGKELGRRPINVSPMIAESPFNR
jgi:hypothetical protein